MSTLHFLRRQAQLSLTALAQLTGIPVRRLAEYEYQGVPIPVEDRTRLAYHFAVESYLFEANRTVPAAQAALTLNQARFGALVAATAALTLGVRTGAAALNQSLQALEPLAARPVAAAAVVSPTATSTPEPLPTSTATPKPTVRPSRPTPQPTIDRDEELGANLLVPAPTTPPAKLPAIPARPNRCPLFTPAGIVVVTQGYGVGTHVPAETMGAVDLAIDADGDGIADPDATRKAVVVAAHAGVVRVDLGTWPAGNHVWVDGSEGWRTGYSHLSQVLVQDGQVVHPGQPLGLAGETGESTGPHLDFQVWHDGDNRDPSEYVLCAAHDHPPLPTVK